MLDFKSLTRFRTQPTSGHEVRFNCPQCGDLSGKLWANFKKGLYTCFKCGNSGTILPRDMAMVRSETGAFPAFKGEEVRQFKWSTYPDIRGSGLSYLRDHNVDVGVAVAWGVRSGKGDAAGRLVIPVKAVSSSGGIRTVFRVAHASNSVSFPKELQSGKRTPWILTWQEVAGPVIQHTKPPINDYFNKRTAILVEGAADALRLSSTASKDTKLSNHTSIVCLWGKHLSEENCFYLASLFDHFYIMLDKEDGLSLQGENVASMRLLAALGAISEGHVQRHSWSRKDKTNTATDPAELSDEKAHQILSKALKETGG